MGVWQFLPAEAIPFLQAAARASGREVLAGGPEGAAAQSKEEIGQVLLRLIFGAHGSGEGLPESLAGLLTDPDSEPAADTVAASLREALDADPVMLTEAVAVISGFYRRQAAGGDVQALVALGDFLRWDDPEGARDAYQEAVAAGHRHAMIDLATVLDSQLADTETALAVCQRAISSGDPDLAAEAWYEVARIQLHRRDAAAARAAFRQAIATGHHEWAPAAMVGLAFQLRNLGETGAAVDLYRQAITAGNLRWSGHAGWALGDLLRRQGNSAAAKAAWQPVIDSGDSEGARGAFVELVNLLRDENDPGALRAAYEAAAARGNQDALYALDQLGQLLAGRGDTAGAHAAWQEAIDAGYEHADWLREAMARSDEPEQEPAREEYPAGLPPQFDPGVMNQAGLRVLEHGLPALPETLTHHMAVPMAYWKAGLCAVVLVLCYSRHGDGEPPPIAFQVVYTRDGDAWIPATGPSLGGSFGHDPIANPGSLRDLDGGALVYGGTAEAVRPVPGQPAMVVAGRAAPQVRYLAVIQDGQEDRRPLESHFGAWVVCTERPGPFQIAGFDEHGMLLARLDVQPRTD